VKKEKVIKSLTSLGFSLVESSVYLYVASNPETTAGEIAKNLKIARSKTYEALNKLTTAGLVSKINKKQVNRYYSAGTSILKGMYSKQMENAKKSIQYISNLDIILPSGPNVRLIEGVEGYKIIKETFVSEMKNGSEVLIVGSPAKLDYGLIKYFETFHKKRMQKNMTLRIIFNSDVSRARIERALKWKNTHVKCLPKNDSPAWIEIYDKRVLISIVSDKMITIVITAPSISTSFKHYFELLWKSTKEPQLSKQ